MIDRSHAALRRDPAPREKNQARVRRRFQVYGVRKVWRGN
jgi:hypothetical protein